MRNITIKPGAIFEMKSGTAYTVARNGAFLRMAKDHRSKKERKLDRRKAG